MATLLDTITEYEDKVLDAAKKVQAPVVEAVSTAVRTLDERLPERTYSLPVTPAEIVDSQYAFAKKVLDAQHDFIKAVVDAAAPLLGVTAKPRAAKRAAKAA